MLTWPILIACSVPYRTALCSVRYTGQEERYGCGSGVRSRPDHHRPLVPLGTARSLPLPQHGHIAQYVLNIVRTDYRTYYTVLCGVFGSRLRRSCPSLCVHKKSLRISLRSNLSLRLIGSLIQSIHVLYMYMLQYVLSCLLNSTALFIEIQ